MPRASRTIDNLPARNATYSVAGEQLTINRLVKCQMSDVRCQKGYTLIEFLVVVGLLVFAIGSAMVFLTSILRGTNQANISAEVKQNGQSVLDSLERQIRGAKSAVGMTTLQLSNISTSAKTGVTLTNSDGSNLHIVCFDQIGVDKNGWIGTSTQATTGSNSDYKAVTNLDLVSGINIICEPGFSVTSGSTINADIVAISFTVDRAVKAPSRTDFIASAKFSTTISLRKY